MNKPPLPPPRFVGSLSLLLTLAAMAGCPAASTVGLAASPSPRKTKRASASPSPAPLATLSSQASEAPASTAPVATPTGSEPVSFPLASGATPTPITSATPTPEASADARAHTVSTLAGGAAGFADGPGADARFNSPNGVDVDVTGNLYVADAVNNRIRVVQATGAVTTLVGGERGFADGEPSTARLDSPYGVAVGPDGIVYVADTGNHRIRRYTPSEGLTTIAGDGTPGLTDGQGTTARFKSPFGVVVGPGGDLFVADAGNAAIRRITTGGLVSTLVGGIKGNANGSFSSAKFYVPNDLAFDGKQGIYVADSINHNVRFIDLRLSLVTTLAGSGTPGNVDDKGVRAKFNAPTGLVVAPNGDVLVADNENHALRRITPDGVVTTIAGGTEGYVEGAAARFAGPTDLVLRDDGTIIVADTKNNRIRIIH